MNTSDALRVQEILRHRAATARVEAFISQALGQTQRAAALRGKAVAYREAYDLLESAKRGGALRAKYFMHTMTGEETP